MLFNSPLSPEKANRIIQLLELSEGSWVLDIGCGTGEFLVRLIEATGVRGLGIDINDDAIAVARNKVLQRLRPGFCEFRTADINEEVFEPECFDLVICMGSTHAFDAGEPAYTNAIRRMINLVRPGGMLLIGEGYWKRPPAQPYLMLIGNPVGVYRSHAENISFAEQRGLISLYAVVSSEDEWDHFEWSHRMAIEKEGQLYPDDPDVAAAVQRNRIWRDGYIRWGRSTMGFGLYLFLKPWRPND